VALKHFALKALQEAEATPVGNGEISLVRFFDKDI
jgi:hypothetical protein